MPQLFPVLVRKLYVSFKNTGILLNILIRVDRAGYCWDFTAFKLTFLSMRHFYFCNINFTINIYLNVHIVYFICGFLIIFFFLFLFP